MNELAAEVQLTFCLLSGWDGRPAAEGQETSYYHCKMNFLFSV